MATEKNLMEECYSLDPERLVYKYHGPNYKIILVHKFPKVDTNIDSLSYYITINGDKVSYNESDTCAIYRPELVSTSQVDDINPYYISTYSISLLLTKLTKDPSDEVKLNLILPFDHKRNIIELQMFSIKDQN